MIGQQAITAILMQISTLIATQNLPTAPPIGHKLSRIEENITLDENSNCWLKFNLKKELLCCLTRQHWQCQHCFQGLVSHWQVFRQEGMIHKLKINYRNAQTDPLCKYHLHSGCVRVTPSTLYTLRSAEAVFISQLINLFLHFSQAKTCLPL